MINLGSRLVRNGVRSEMGSGFHVDKLKRAREPVNNELVVTSGATLIGDRMNTYIALSRGINVGGKNSLPMIVVLLENIGARKIKTTSNNDTRFTD